MKPGVIFEVSGCGDGKSNGVDTNISEISFFNMNKKCLDDYLNNLNDDYSINNGVSYFNCWNVRDEGAKNKHYNIYNLNQKMPYNKFDFEIYNTLTTINNRSFNSKFVSTFLNKNSLFSTILSYDMWNNDSYKEFIWYDNKTMSINTLYNNKYIKNKEKIKLLYNLNFYNGYSYNRIAYMDLTSDSSYYQNGKIIKNVIIESKNRKCYDTGINIKMQKTIDLKKLKSETYIFSTSKRNKIYMGGGL